MAQDPQIRRQIAGLGNGADPQTLGVVRALFADEQETIAAGIAPSLVDASYGPHERHKLDLYAPARRSADGGAPILLWVHGGGFLRGAKSDPDHPFEAHVGRFAARNGFLGAVVNYRLAPEVVWPSGGEDLALAIDWLRSRAGDYGGDPNRIILMGSSAGAMHIVSYLRLHPQTSDIRAAVLLSGLYGYTPIEDRERAYYQGVEDAYLGSHPLQSVIQSELPVFVACAEFDPPRFQSEFLSLEKALLDARGRLPASYIALGHNHYSLAFHVGGADARLTDEVLAFISDHLGG